MCVYEPTQTRRDSGVKSAPARESGVTLTPQGAIGQAHRDGRSLRTIAAWAVPPVCENTVRRAVAGNPIDPRTVRRFSRSATAPGWFVQAMVWALAAKPAPRPHLADKFRDPDRSGTSDLADIPHVVTRCAAAEAILSVNLVHLASDGKLDDEDKAKLAPLVDEVEGWNESKNRFALFGTADVEQAEFVAGDRR